ncbi:MAG TPA: hypothetical protein VFL95_01175, partial [Gemmatimonadales bacterium]|nr:hypothetical protein [Gemmatimonadales bacterium]
MRGPTIAVMLMLTGAAAGAQNPIAWDLRAAPMVTPSPLQLSALNAACDGGSASACSALGYKYATGSEVARDFARAVALYTQGCDGGDL